MFRFIGFFFALSITCSAHGSIINGSLTGDVGSGVPNGWTALGDSPSTVDINSPFLRNPAGPSPDGGTWVRVDRVDVLSVSESFGQTLTGLIIGTSYDLAWHEANFGALVGFQGSWSVPNAIEVLIDNVSIGTGNLLSASFSGAWQQASLSFTATAGSHDLAFRLSQPTSDNGSSLSIDGISLAAASVPEPATLTLFGLGLAGLGFSRRKRA